MEEHIVVGSYWGTAARNEYIHKNDNNRLAVVLPGLRYTNMAPLLYYPLRIALESGYDALSVEYGFQRGDGGFTPDGDSIERLAKETAEAVSKCLQRKHYREMLFIGKSIGTLVQIRLKDEFNEYPQRHIFLTPLPGCVGAIKQTDCLAAVGTNDRVFKSEHIAEIAGLKNVKLVTVEGADHSMEKGNYKEDLKILAEVCGNIYTFINKQIKHN